MQERVQDMAALEVLRATREVHESSGREASLLVEHETDAPDRFRDRLAAMTASSLAGRSALGAGDPGQPSVGGGDACGALERVRLGHDLARKRQSLDYRVGPPVGRA